MLRTGTRSPFPRDRVSLPGVFFMSGFLLLAASEDATHNLSMFDPVSPPAESIRNLSVLVFAIIGFIFIVVEGILLYCVFRFRHRGESSATEPPQVYGSK